MPATRLPSCSNRGDAASRFALLPDLQAEDDDVDTSPGVVHATPMVRLSDWEAASASAAARREAISSGCLMKVRARECKGSVIACGARPWAAAVKLSARTVRAKDKRCALTNVERSRHRTETVAAASSFRYVKCIRRDDTSRQGHVASPAVQEIEVRTSGAGMAAGAFCDARVLRSAGALFVGMFPATGR
eukprot:scaffold73313_cov27-Tisochrysis_lutea.AAC.8